MACHDYILFGLQVRSEMPLPELVPQAPDNAPDVVIRFDTIEAEGAARGFASTETGIVLSVPEIARYLIQNGREIVIAPAKGASERNLRLFLLGSAFGALLHQRGLVPLHANAVDIDGQAVGFCGPSGAGKSTLAAWFSNHGHPILSDDVCVIDFDSAGRAVAQPGLPRLRLCDDALEATGRNAAEFERSFDRMHDARDKYDVPIREGSGDRALPLGAVYLLGRAPEGRAEGSIVRLRGAEAVGTIVSNTYRGKLLPEIGGSSGHLVACARIAGQVPVFRADRLWGLDRFEDESRALAVHARSIRES